jgi:hypothetical protein
VFPDVRKWSIEPTIVNARVWHQVGDLRAALFRRLSGDERTMRDRAEVIPGSLRFGEIVIRRSHRS